MNNTGKFIATVSVNGRAMDSKGNIINRDTNGFPTMWFNVMAGGIPNRQTVAGSVVQRAGVPIDGNGVIAPGSTEGHPFAKRIIYGYWLHSSDHDDYGPQFTWNVIKDMTNDPVTEIEAACKQLGEPYVFTVDRPELPEDYQRRTTQHIGRNAVDSRVHGTANQAPSNVVNQAREMVGGDARTSDAIENPELVIQGEASNLRKRNLSGENTSNAQSPRAGSPNPDNPDEIIS
jgi:hypothetical protein